MKNRKFLIILAGVVIALVGSTSAQTNIRGSVIDAITRKPLSDVNIFIEEYKEGGTFTNSNGEFKLEIQSFPALVSLSFVGYHRKDIMLVSDPGGVLKLEIIPETMQLNEVAITGGRYLYFLKKENFYVRDYAFSESFIWIIGYPQMNLRAPELRAISFSGDVLCKVPTHRKDMLYPDAMGNVHLVSRDSAHQLFFDGESIQRPYSQAQGKAFDDLAALQYIDPTKAIIKEVSGAGNLNRYWEFQFSDSSKTLLHSSYDRNLFDKEEDANTYEHGPIPDVRGTAGPSAQFVTLENMRLASPMFRLMSDQQIKDHVLNTTGQAMLPGGDGGGYSSPTTAFTNYGLKRLAHRPIVSRFFLYKDQQIIFEDRERMIWVYHPDKDIPDFYHCNLPDNGMDFNMIQDKSDQSLYVTYGIGGGYHISKIDPMKGTVIKTVDLKGFSFVENIQIHSERVYFMHQNPLGTRTMNLYSFVF